MARKPSSRAEEQQPEPAKRRRPCLHCCITNLVRVSCNPALRERDCGKLEDRADKWTPYGSERKRKREEEFSSRGDRESKNEEEFTYCTSDSEEKEFVDDDEFGGIPPEFFDPVPDELTKSLRIDLGPLGYPMPKRFEGEARFFACTGIFVDFNESTSRILTSASLIRTSDENMISDDLTIQVYLPNKQHAPGTLQYYDSGSNIAVISVMGFRCLRTAVFPGHMPIEPHREVVAIGRVFQSGKLMATCGILTDRKSELDCKELMISTCKMTKAGIGGPLIDYDGSFIGMNFYGTEETRYLPSCQILELLKRFDAEGTVPATKDTNPNRWPVPEPLWFYPSRIRRWRSRKRRQLNFRRRA